MSLKSYQTTASFSKRIRPDAIMVGLPGQARIEIAPDGQGIITRGLLGVEILDILRNSGKLVGFNRFNLR